MVEKNLTLKDLRKATGAPGYLIQYLKDCGRLSIVRESRGRGYPTIYSSDAVQVIKDHLVKQNR